MRLSSTSTITMLVTLGVVACSGSGATLSPVGEGGSAETSIGGSADVGGNPGTGGANSNGGTPSTGGKVGAGGVVTTGGSPQGAGGIISTGGAIQGVGGVVSTGGNRNTGGVFVNAGGTPVGTGGTPPILGGGTPATGGANPSTGGTPSTGNCVDIVPPNQGTTTCADWKTYGQCGSSWFTTSNFCAATCNACSGVSAGGAPSTGGMPSTGGRTGNGGTPSTGGNPAAGGLPVTGGRPPTGGMPSTGGNPATGGTTTSSGTSLPPITGGINAWASRYWDCCKPACGWKANVSGGSPMSSCDKSNNSLGSNYDAVNACQGGGTAYMCWSGVPWSVSDTVSYGFAAASGSDYVCGRCFQIQFTGSSHNGGANPGAAAIKDKQMIIQVINNGGVAEDQFDLLIPGGGVGALNACSTQWGSSDLGAQYGGFLSGCNGDTACVQQKCQTVFAGKADLMAGCTWFLNWFKAADNPNFVYKQVTCPSALTSKSGMQG